MKHSKLVSYCLFTYNQEAFVKESIEGALSQTYSPLQIIISDDCSTDNTFKIIEKTIKHYVGPHTVVLNRNPNNLGIGGHFSKMCYSIATGEYIITSAGDDISKSNHVEKAVASIEKFKNIKMMDFSGEIIDEKGNVRGEISLDFEYKKNTLEDYLKLRNIHHFAPGRIIKRELLDSFPPVSARCPTEDSVMVLRSLMLGGFVRMNDPLVFYRKHQGNISSITGLSRLSNFAIVSQNMKDVIHLYQNDIIGEFESEMLLKRIWFEYKLRIIKYSKRKYKVQSIIRPVLLRVYKFIYRVTNDRAGSNNLNKPISG